MREPKRLSNSVPRSPVLQPRRSPASPLSIAASQALAPLEASSFHRPDYDFAKLNIYADPIAMVRSHGGMLETSAAVDSFLRPHRARAATLGSRVLLRSDLASRPDSPVARYTLAHETVHLLQQRGAHGHAALDANSSSRAEADAERGARDLLAGRRPTPSYREAGPVPRFLLDDADFQLPEGATTLATARGDALWVEADIIDYAVTAQAPWIFSVLYADGQVLEIPLEKMFFQGVDSASVTMFRRHRASGRLIPCRISQQALGALPAESAPTTAASIHTAIPARFDPDLTPRIIAYLNEAQAMQLSMGLLGIAALWAGGSVPGRPPLGAGVAAATRVTASSSARYLALRQAARRAAAQTGRTVIAASAARLTQIADELVTATAAIQANGPRFIRAAALLSSRTGLNALEKAQVIQEFARRIGFGFSRRGLIDAGSHLLLESEDAIYAFRILKDNAQIWYGRFSIEAREYAWTLLVP